MPKRKAPLCEVLETDIPTMMRKKNGKAYRTRNYSSLIAKGEKVIIRTNRNIGGWCYELGKDQDECELNRTIGKHHHEVKKASDEFTLDIGIRTVKRPVRKKDRRSAKKSFSRCCNKYCRQEKENLKFILRLICEKHGEPYPL